MSWRPRLRADVFPVAQSGDLLEALFDPLVNRRIEVDPVMRGLVPLLDGTRTVDELVIPDVPRETTLHALRALVLLCLVEGAGETILDRVRKSQAGAPHKPLVLAGSRFACQGSGECCQNYTFGPLEPEDVAALAALDEEGAVTELAGGPWLKKSLEGGREDFFLVTRDERCVFLQEDQRCGVHAKFGADAKPGLCRFYPIRYLPTLDGLKLYDSGECATFPISARSGKTLAEDVPRLAKLLPKRLALHHPITLLSARTPCDYGHLLSLQRRLVAMIEARTGATATLLAVLELTRAFVQELERCPLDAGEPERTLDAFFARPLPEPGPAPMPDAEGKQAIARLAEEMLEVVVPAIQESHPHVTGHGLTVKLLRQFAELCQLVQAIAGHGPESPLPELFEKVVRVRLDEPELDEALRLKQRHAVFGEGMLVHLRVPPAMLRLAVNHLTTTLGAKLSAALRGAERATLADLGFGSYLSQRILRLDGLQRVLMANEESAWTLGPQLIALAGWQP